MQKSARRTASGGAVDVVVNAILTFVAVASVVAFVFRYGTKSMLMHRTQLKSSRHTSQLSRRNQEHLKLTWISNADKIHQTVVAYVCSQAPVTLAVQVAVQKTMTLAETTVVAKEAVRSVIVIVKIKKLP